MTFTGKTGASLLSIGKPSGLTMMQTGFQSSVDADNRGRTPPPDANAKRWRKDGARAMTPKERIKVHAEIERTNRAKLDAWKRKQKEGGKVA